MSKPARPLQVGERTYFYRVLHAHGPRDATGRASGCRDILTLRSDAPRASPLRLVFAVGPGRIVGDAYNAKGVVVHHEQEADASPRALNLHRPGVARAFLDAALAAGWDGISRDERDGWAYFEAVYAAVGA